MPEINDGVYFVKIQIPHSQLIKKLVIKKI